MSFKETYNRITLQQMEPNYRKEKVYHFVDTNITCAILHSARMGLKEYFWVNPVTKHHLGGQPHPSSSPFTNEELVEALKEKFPDTKIEYQETWIETRPGVKEQKKGILIDWS